MPFCANRGVVVFAVLLLVGYPLARSRSDLSGVAGSLWAGGAALIALGLAQIIGNIVDRARRYETLANVHVLVDETTDFSFPSDHATLVGAVAVGLFFVDRWLGLAAASPQSSWRSPRLRRRALSRRCPRRAGAGRSRRMARSHRRRAAAAPRASRRRRLAIPVVGRVSRIEARHRRSVVTDRPSPALVRTTLGQGAPQLTDVNSAPVDQFVGASPAPRRWTSSTAFGPAVARGTCRPVPRCGPSSERRRHAQVDRNP